MCLIFIWLLFCCKKICPEDRHVPAVELDHPILDKHQEEHPQEIEEEHGINEDAVHCPKERPVVRDTSSLALCIDVDDGTIESNIIPKYFRWMSNRILLD